MVTRERCINRNRHVSSKINELKLHTRTQGCTNRVNDVTMSYMYKIGNEHAVPTCARIAFVCALDSALCVSGQIEIRHERLWGPRWDALAISICIDRSPRFRPHGSTLLDEQTLGLARVRTHVVALPRGMPSFLV